MNGTASLKGSLRDLVVLALCAMASAVYGQSASREHWVGSWATSQQIPEPQNALTADDLRDATLRQIVHLSLGGQRLRVHLSNAFGTGPLHVTAVHVARSLSPASSDVDGATDQALSFAGKPDVTIPAGSEYISDALHFAAAPLSDLAISLHLDTPPEQQTGHPGSRSTSYLVHGDQTATPHFNAAKHFDHWYQIAGVDVAAKGQAVSVVTLGDSITDGHGATTNGNDRWPDILATRLQVMPATRNIGVLNHGIGGNRLLLDGLGPNALARFDRDVLAQTGARFLVILEGVNDLGTATRTAEISQSEHEALVARITAAYAQMIDRAHTHSITVYGATITPYSGSEYYHPGVMSEADRQKINAWIRTSRHFDAVIDFDATLRDPANRARLLPMFDSGDHLHPSAAGYRAMAGAIPLALFARPTGRHRSAAANSRRR